MTDALRPGQAPTVAPVAPPVRGLPAGAFFADKNRAFWLLQVAGWTFYFVLRALSGLANNMGLSFVVPAAIATITGFSLTLIMSAIYRRVIRLKPLYVWTLTALTLFIAAAIFSVLEVWATATFHRPGWRPEGIEFLGAILLDLSVLAAWTGLYFGINYYLLLDEQADAMARIAAQANEAQLAMLRYQLNPHFLFNTLNSISTLVLLRQTERANAMLSRLSSFLRYSLAGEPTQLVPLRQELEALRQYLEIEKMRFEDRLRTSFHWIAPADQALVPSLLLQPLVENAVKYAVTPLEEGADIRIEAHVAGARTIITVADTGPGLGHAPAQPGAGVGLRNIRDRLSQTYGEDHRLELRPARPRGLVVTLDIPFQPASVGVRETA
jgi:signal transduction histidine kinase